MPGLASYTALLLGIAAAAAASAEPAAGSAPLSVDEQVAAYQTRIDSIAHEEAGYNEAANFIGKPEEVAVFVAGSDDELDALLRTIDVNISHYNAVHELYSDYGSYYQRLLEGNPDLQDLAADVARAAAARTADADQAHSLWQEMLSYAQEAKSLGDEDHERRETIFGHLNDDNRASRKLESDMGTLSAQIDQDMGRATLILHELLAGEKSRPITAGAPEVPDVDGITFLKSMVTPGRGILKSATGVMDLAAIAPGTHVDGVVELDTSAIDGAVLRLSDRTQIMLANATTAQLDYFESTASGRLKSGTITVIKGSFDWTAGRNYGIAAELTLIVPAGQVRFRGREFAVTVNADGSGSIKLRDGDMEITPKTPRPVSVNSRKHGNGTIQLPTNSRILFNADGSWGPPVPNGF